MDNPMRGIMIANAIIYTLDASDRLILLFLRLRVADMDLNQRDTMQTAIGDKYTPNKSNIAMMEDPNFFSLAKLWCSSILVKDISSSTNGGEPSNQYLLVQKNRKD